MLVCGDGSGGGIRRGTTVLTGIPCGNMFRARCFVRRLDGAKLVLGGVLSFFWESGARATKHREGDGVDTSLSKLHAATRNAHVDANFQGCE